MGACLIAGLALLGPIEEKFVDVTDLFVPTEDGTKDKAFISRGGLSSSRHGHRDGGHALCTVGFLTIALEASPAQAGEEQV